LDLGEILYNTDVQFSMANMFRFFYSNCLRVTLLLAILGQNLAICADKQNFSGTLVDVTCVSRRSKDLEGLRAEHTRKCLLMPICADSGYALLTKQGEVFRFDSKGNELARGLIEKHSHQQDWSVSVEGIADGHQLAVIHMKMAKHD
jgi:hypothetical protein